MVEKNKLKKIDGIEFSAWILITILYVIVYMVISGWVQTSFQDIEYIGTVPIDVKSALLALFVALWLPITIILKQIFTQKKVFGRRRK